MICGGLTLVAKAGAYLSRDVSLALQGAMASALVPRRKREKIKEKKKKSCLRDRPDDGGMSCQAHKGNSIDDGGFSKEFELLCLLESRVLSSARVETGVSDYRLGGVLLLCFSTGRLLP